MGTLTPKTYIWAHRGASGHAPENTLEAFALAAKMGADGVELDVRFTKDGEIVIAHDEKLDRISNGQGLIGEYTYEQLLAFDFGYKFYGEVRGIKIATLRQVYELLELDIGKCVMAVAAKKDFRDNTEQTLRVATKFSNIARKYYGEKCRDIDIIHLNGSIEIAPILGLSDVIVDIVETGKTLYENNLAPFETVVPISARLISNKASYKFKQEEIEKIRLSLAEIVRNSDD